MNYRLTSFLLITAIMIYALPATLGARPHSLPMTLDYAMMQSLVLRNYYTGPEATSVVLDEDDGCRKITLSDPRFSEIDGQLAFETKLRVKIGETFFNNCWSPLVWEGYLVLHEEPYINASDWTMSFNVLDSRLLTLKRKPASIAGIVWNLVKENVHGYLAGIKIDLALPVKQLREFLTPLFTQLQSQETITLVKSIQPGTIGITSQGLKINNTIEIPDRFYARPQIVEKQLTEHEIESFISMWEKWDTFLITILLSLLDQPLLDEERQILLDAVLESRYNFVHELNTPVSTHDFVREQFILTWEQIHTIFRRHLSDEADKSLLSYLAFFSASDALRSLDAVGPSLGIEITRDGFTRLIRLLLDDDFPTTTLSMRPNPQLRELLGLKSWDKRQPSTRIQNPGQAVTAALHKLKSAVFCLNCAWASDTGKAGWTREMMSKWICDRPGFDTYLANVRHLLQENALSTIESGRLSEKHEPLFHQMVMATAWQESCFRQYKQDKTGMISYLRSYNNTSVGIMQVNERVWKGIYDIESLRWDIGYNARAGCEILDIYFNRYALRYMKKMGDTSDWSNQKFAGSIYAMYNGGPRHFRKFLSRHEQNRLYKSDRLFKEKFQWVENEKWQQLTKCLF